MIFNYDIDVGFRGMLWKRHQTFYREFLPKLLVGCYLLSNTTQISNDGGASWTDLNNEFKHVDDHAIAFRPDDPDYILFGSDGGLYESYDHTDSWRSIDNLPVTQFYKVAVDDNHVYFEQCWGGRFWFGPIIKDPPDRKNDCFDQVLFQPEILQMKIHLSSLRSSTS